MPTVNVRQEFKKHIVPESSGDDSDLERLLRNSADDLLPQGLKQPKLPSRHTGSADQLPLTQLAGAGGQKRPYPRQRDEAIQVTLLDHEKTMKHQKMKIKRLSQENVKLEGQLKGYEQRLREMRQDAVYRDLTGGEKDDQGLCAPVREAWRSFRGLFRTTWFRFWLRLQLRLEDKQRRLSREELPKPVTASRQQPEAVTTTTRTTKEIVQVTK